MTADARYRLAALRTVRATDEAVRRGELATAVGDAGETEQRLALARSRVAAAEHALAAAIAARPIGPTTPARLALADRFAARRRRDLADARDAEVRATAAHTSRLDDLDLARARLARARADRELVERHFARWRERARRVQLERT